MATKKTAYEAPTPASDKKKALQTALSQLEKTYGKGCGQTGQMLSDGSVVFITHFLYSPPFSDNYDGIGIMPDYEVALAEEWQMKNLFLVPHNEDAQLIRGTEVLLNQITQEQ